MKYFGLDCETDDGLLTDQGPSWIFGQGEILVTGIYDAQKQKKKSIDGNGGQFTRDLLFSSDTAIVGAKISYDLEWLCAEFVIEPKDTTCQLIDVAIAESLIDEYQPFSLDALAIKYLRERKGHEKLATIATGYGWKGDFRKHLKKLWYGETPDGAAYKEEIREYVISDADQPVRIWELQKPILEEQGLMPAFEMNMKMVRITSQMKYHGIRIDHERWKINSAICQEAYQMLNTAFVGKYGEINFRSGKQMAELFDEHEIPYKCKLVFKGWAPEGRKFTKDDWFSGDDVWDQRKRLKESFPNVRVAKGKIILMVPSQYAERTTLQASRMGYQVTCNPSINKFTFNANKATYPLVAEIVELKQVSNIIDKFLGDKFHRFMVLDKNGDWRVHGNFDPVGARQTGRLSSSSPNLQNIPSKTVLMLAKEVVEQMAAKYGKSAAFVMKDGEYTGEVSLAYMCREVFVADRGQMFVKLDFSGQENVLQAHFAVGANGERIRQMYRDNPRLDEHQFVASRSGLEEQHGKKAGRKYAKNVRFGLAYGMQVTTMCEQFAWEKAFAEELIQAVKDASPWVPETMDTIQDMLLGRGKYQGRRRRYIKTIIGRRTHLREGMDRDAYKFYNYLIQGSAADMMKQALIKYAESDAAKIVTLLLTVHDEGGFSVPMTAAGVAAVLLIQVFFCSAVKLEIPINADPEAGKNWADVDGQHKGDDGLFDESVQDMLKRVIHEISSGKVDIVDKTALPCEDDDIDFDALGDEDDDEEEDIEA